MKPLKEELGEEEYRSLHNVMWIIRKRPDQLSDEEKETLHKLFDWSPELKLAYLFSITLTSIFDSELTPAVAQSKLTSWINLAQNNNLNCFSTFSDTLNRYMTPITNYFIDRKNSGFVEGLNNKAKLLKRLCYGVLNLTHFFNAFRWICQDMANSHKINRMRYTRIPEEPILLSIPVTYYYSNYPLHN